MAFGVGSRHIASEKHQKASFGIPFNGGSRQNALEENQRPAFRTTFDDGPERVVS